MGTALSRDCKGSEEASGARQISCGIDFIGGNEYIGDYYGVGNDVIHGHWDTGFGTLSQIKISKVDGSAFDLNYFILTSNTVSGGGPADASERVYIHASADGVTSSYSMLLPSEDWGFPATSIFLSAAFDNIKAFWFVAETPVACFGMDSFFLDEAPPEPDPSEIPEPGTWALFGLGALCIFGCRKIRPDRPAC